ncbi:MAG: PSD1 and planctomycete cytochrome C domain-containing protein [Planctomycetota bacterium]
MMHLLENRFGLKLLLVWIVAVSTAHADEKEAFFEEKIRPLLVEHCIDCHGPDDQSGELRLDRRVHVFRGGASGAALVPGKPETSRLIRAIGYQDNSMQMPPDNKLPEEAIKLLTEWVAQGAYWPEEQDAEPAESESMTVDEFIDSQRQSHWSYQPIVAPIPPEVSTLPAEFVRPSLSGEVSEVDRFVLSRLADANLEPNQRADRRSLIHRASFVLTGLPPTFEEVEAFIADDSPDAFERLLDRLLESPHYGERWARHWLDIARYGDTKGYLAGSRETRYPFAFTYRDYVIDAFNDDKPFDQFIIEQLAADRLNLEGAEKQKLAAMGLLTVGRKFMNRRADIIDDQIDVVTRGFLGITVSCARCHDHKYDAVPTADYYSLYGVFDSSREPDELPLLGEPQPSAEYDSFLAAKAEKQAKVDKYLDERKVETENELRSRIADYLVMLPDALNQLQRGKLKFQGERGPLRRAAAFRWYHYLATPAQSSQPIWALWRQLSAIPDDEFGAKSLELLDKVSEEAKIQLPQRIVTALKETKPQSMKEAAKVFGQQLEAVHSSWVEAKKKEPALTALPDSDDEALRQMLYAPLTPTTLNREQMIAHLDQGQRNRYNQLLNQVNGVEVTHPGAPSRGMVLVDKPKPTEPVIFRRGVPSNRGDRVPRRFLQVLAHVDGGQPFKQGSGRLELARAIASDANPLTARVIVNRIWQHHFGEGLVRTPSDFGIRGERPTHPELLDYLANKFLEDGWSIKKLQKRIMLTATWQQASVLRSDAMTEDPENRMLWHMPRQRLEFEPLRDRLLVAAGRLDDRIGGRSVKIHEDATRRALYAYIDREDLPGLLASFDLPSPDASQAQRTQTTVPQQALYLMNSGFVLEQAQSLATRTVAASAEADQSEVMAERIRQIYRLALSREPDGTELSVAMAFVDPEKVAEFRASRTESIEEKPLWQYGYGFWDADEETVRFTPLPHFEGSAWQVSTQFPDPKFGHLRLSADGGHAGSVREESPVRRWIAPVDGVVKVTGQVSHRGKKGDGVVAQVFHSSTGLQGEWIAFGDQQGTEVPRITVKAGDAIDFVVGCKEGPSYDSFRWAPKIELVELSTDESVAGRWQVGSLWSAQADFDRSSKQLAANMDPQDFDPWVQLAQVLLLSNEFAFVD